MIEVLVLVGSEYLVKEPASHVSALLHDRTLSEAAPDVRHASGRLARSLLLCIGMDGRHPQHSFRTSRVIWDSPSNLQMADLINVPCGSTPFRDRCIIEGYRYLLHEKICVSNNRDETLPLLILQNEIII